MDYLRDEKKQIFSSTVVGKSSSIAKGKKQQQQQQKQQDSKTWSVLQDEFMMGATLKDWDREEEE
jgi:hypothetical protein